MRHRIPACLMLIAGVLLLGHTALALPISYNLTYEPWKAALGGDDTEARSTVFFDTADFTGSGTEWVTLTAMDITFNGPFTLNVDLTVHVPNTATGACVHACGGQDYVPYAGQFIEGVFTGYLTGRQPVATIEIAHMGYGNGPQGPIGGILFFLSNAPTKFNTEVDEFVLTSVSGPFMAPEPAAPFLLGLALLAIRRAGK